jgi:hypothetical protein
MCMYLRVLGAEHVSFIRLPASRVEFVCVHVSARIKSLSCICLHLRVLRAGHVSACVCTH